MNPANFDFHTHSSVSDGLLSPTELVRRAAANGVTWLALTDHDELGGLGEAALAARECGIDFLGGVEVSIEWREKPIHIIGLGHALDTDQSALQAGLQALRLGRVERARRMADALEAIGIDGVYEGALRYAGNPYLISRAHFARYMVEIGIAKDVSAVFHSYLTPGRPGYVDHRWVSLQDALSWIHAVGGVAVVAHPSRYRLSGGEMRALLTEFKELGGQGIEVIYGSLSHSQSLHYARLARYFGFHASRGSDFHGPEESFSELGSLAPLPLDLKPVWRFFT